MSKEELYQIKKAKIRKYKENTQIPEFDSPEAYYEWLETEDGKKHNKAIEEIHKTSLKEYKGRGGARPGAGRKKKYSDSKKITKVISSQSNNRIQLMADYFGISQNEALNILILNGFNFTSKKHRDLRESLNKKQAT